VLDTPAEMTAQFQIAWDDHLILRVNQDKPVDLGEHEAGTGLARQRTDELDEAHATLR
jgi:hypothetical protein